MSVDAVKWAKDLRLGGRPHAKSLLMMLADRAGLMESGEYGCWPGLDLLMGEVELSRATVKRQIAWLESVGLISRRRRMSKRQNSSYVGLTARTSNMYILHLEVTQAQFDANLAGLDRPAAEVSKPEEVTVSPSEMTGQNGGSGAGSDGLTCASEGLREPRARREEPSERTISSSSSGSGTVPALAREEDEDDLPSGVGESLRQMEPGLDVDDLRRRLQAGGVVPRTVDLVAALREVRRRQGQKRVGRWSALFAHAILAEPESWQTADHMWEAAVESVGEPELGDRRGPHRADPDTIAIATRLSLCSRGQTSLREDQVDAVRHFIATYPGGWEAAVAWVHETDTEEGHAA